MGHRHITQYMKYQGIQSPVGASHLISSKPTYPEENNVPFGC